MNDKYLAGSKHAGEPERRPFDLEAAKRGEPLVTRDGRSVKFVAYVQEAQIYPVVAFIEGAPAVHSLTDDGRYWSDNHSTSENDLFMAPKPKRTVWLNLYEKATWRFGIHQRNSQNPERTLKPSQSLCQSRSTYGNYTRLLGGHGAAPM